MSVTQSDCKLREGAAYFDVPVSKVAPEEVVEEATRLRQLQLVVTRCAAGHHLYQQPTDLPWINDQKTIVV